MEGIEPIVPNTPTNVSQGQGALQRMRPGHFERIGLSHPSLQVEAFVIAQDDSTGCRVACVDNGHVHDVAVLRRRRGVQEGSHVPVVSNHRRRCLVVRRYRILVVVEQKRLARPLAVEMLRGKAIVKCLDEIVVIYPGEAVGKVIDAGTGPRGTVAAGFGLSQPSSSILL